MSTKVTIGGDRLGAGKRESVTMHGYNRSNHDLSYAWRSTMAVGVLTPFLKKVALPGDTFDIDLHASVLTQPTIGPLFGSFKLQLDVFQVPIRLYQGMLHMNMLGIGMDMSAVKLPVFTLTGQAMRSYNDFEYINKSSVLSYLGVKGIASRGYQGLVVRNFNAIPYLAYVDIFKNYYANKQEDNAYVIHNKAGTAYPTITNTSALVGTTHSPTKYAILVTNVNTPPITMQYTYQFEPVVQILISFLTGENISNLTIDDFMINSQPVGGGAVAQRPASELFSRIEITGINGTTAYIRLRGPKWAIGTSRDISAAYWTGSAKGMTGGIELTPFRLKDIDDCRVAILQNNNAAAFNLSTWATTNNKGPYNLLFEATQTGTQPNITRYLSLEKNMEGLLVKTYNSDLFNNWISTEWIDGPNGIAAVTAIDTSGGSFTIDELNLSKKIYNMLNRIALSGGSYDDWLDAVYDHDRQKSAENPMYMGGLIQDVQFEEVISTAATSDSQLGQIAGRGRIGNFKRGGKIIVKVSEPSYIIGIASLTPIIDYSQGNDWDNNLVTMNDLHKPALDAIGFQDLITEQMYWGTSYQGVADATRTTIKTSAGKQPAWINYMTAVNKTFANFANESEQMWMTLNRKYVVNWNSQDDQSIRDLTTYIDPAKYNNIFADTRLDAQNFWVQIGVGIEARRKMSAKVIPNL